jgi:hypothetical protein
MLAPEKRIEAPASHALRSGSYSSSSSSSVVRSEMQFEDEDDDEDEDDSRPQHGRLLSLRRLDTRDERA